MNNEPLSKGEISMARIRIGIELQNIKMSLHQIVLYSSSLPESSSIKTELSKYKFSALHHKLSELELKLKQLC